MTFFLTFHGLLLCQLAGSGRLVHRPVNAVGADAEPVGVDFPVEQMRPTFDRFLGNQPQILDELIVLGGLRNVALARAADQRCVTFQVDGGFLNASHHGEITISATALDSESFLPVSESDLTILREMLTNDWVIRSSGDLVQAGQVSLGLWYSLRFGELSFDLRFQVPFDRTAWPFRLTLLRDGWRIEQICLYRPLIYFTAYGHPAVLGQLYASIRSLIELGEYRGDILVFTDQPHAELHRNLPPAVHSRLYIFHAKPSDPVGFVASKYMIVDLDWAASFQPVMFMDPDILFDADVAPMLQTVARLDRIAAPLEPFSPLGTAPSVGSGLLQIDGFSPRFAAGVNCGTIGIPNIPQHAASLRLIRSIIVNHAAINGRAAFDWIDQEVANYVSFRLADFDSAAITPFVRYGGWPNTSPSVAGRAGLVHFWPALSPENKLEAMRDYRRRLDDLIGTNGR